MKGPCSLALIFLGLCLPKLASAQSGATLLVRTGMSCEWQLDGHPMGLLKGGDFKEIPVSIGSHVIYSASLDRLDATRIEVEIDHGQKTIFITPEKQTDLQSKVQPVDEGGKRALADASKTWTDLSTGLMWTKKDNGSDVNWNQATAYCSNLQLAGFSDWRLPSIDELQEIYDPSISVVTVFDNGVTYTVHAKGDLHISGWHWSSTQGDAPGKPWQDAWLLHFGGEKPRGKFPLGFTYSMRALCVRPAAD